MKEKELKFDEPFLLNKFFTLLNNMIEALTHNDDTERKLALFRIDCLNNYIENDLKEKTEILKKGLHV